MTRPTSLPPDFLARIPTIFGSSTRVQDIVKTFVDRPTTLRVNTLKASRGDIEESLKQNGIKIKRVPWYSDAFILTDARERDVQKLSLYEDGAVYLQSLASMVPPLVLAPKPGEKVLDLTAAPGSKTSQIAALMGGSGELVANDDNQIRFQRLEHNMKLLSVPMPFLTLFNLDGVTLCARYPEYFDRILLDAPCSAEARFVASNYKSFGYWELKQVNKMAAAQRKLLLAAWGSLKPGGTIVYSTCTMSPEENELQVAGLQDTVGNEVIVEDARLQNVRYVPPVLSWGAKKVSSELSKTGRIYPTNEIEPFFVAKLRKM